MSQPRWISVAVLGALLISSTLGAGSEHAAGSKLVLAQAAAPAVEGTATGTGPVLPAPPAPSRVVSDREYTYDPSGRRDPFNPLIQKGDANIKPDANLPPLQRVGLTELQLIGIIWGGFGYTAMVQTPDGKGYAVRRGTRVGPNNGRVSQINEKGIVVTERFTDIYGKEQEREYIKLLHASEDSE